MAVEVEIFRSSDVKARRLMSRAIPGWAWRAERSEARVTLVGGPAASIWEGLLCLPDFNCFFGVTLKGTDPSETRAMQTLHLWAVLMCAVAPAAFVHAQWEAGWGFAAHHGLPPMRCKRYQINQSLVAYFVANNTGLANPAEIAAEIKAGVLGIGWNLNHLATSKAGGLEQFEAQQAAGSAQGSPARYQGEAARPDMRWSRPSGPHSGKP